MDVDEAETTQNISVMSPPPKRFHPQPSPMQQQHKQQQQRVRNPFEAALADRLHLPLIASPSLFQRPATPQLSSTQFEWTIDEVSSIKPANVEPHETQFQDSPDPEYEARAQLAISSYFKEHQIVPSPVNCSVRQRIILAEINGNTPIGKPGRRIRDFGTQTALSLPVDLPPELEEALRPYFQPHIAGCYAEDGNSVHNWHDGSGFSSNSSVQSGGAHNVSMRRKLFDIHNIILWDEGRKVHTPKTPQYCSSSVVDAQVQRPLPLPSIVGKLSDSLDKSSGDLMSPILGSDCLSGSPRSPNNFHVTGASDGSQNSNSSNKLKRHNLGSGKSGKTKTRRRSFLFNPSDTEELSPINPTHLNKPQLKRHADEHGHDQAQLKDFITPAKVRKPNFARRRLPTAPINNDDEDDYDIETNSAKFTPDRSSSPLHSFHSSASISGNNNDHATTVTTESFHVRISRLAVNSSKSTQNDVGKEGITPNDDTEIGDIVDDDDAMQVSQLSMQNSNLSSSSINSHCDTPTGKRRSASRKNLSQSFSANWALEDDESDDNELAKDSEKGVAMPNMHFSFKNGDMAKKQLSGTSKPKAQLPEIADFIETATAPAQTLCDAHKQTQQQQQSGNFYRTDSGFNEMTNSGSTSNGLSMLSQQDELSREAIVYKANEAVGNITGEQHISHYCSTPSKPNNEERCYLKTIDELNNDL